MLNKLQLADFKLLISWLVINWLLIVNIHILKYKHDAKDSITLQSFFFFFFKEFLTILNFWFSLFDNVSCTLADFNGVQCRKESVTTNFSRRNDASVCCTWFYWGPHASFSPPSSCALPLIKNPTCLFCTLSQVVETSANLYPACVCMHAHMRENVVHCARKCENGLYIFFFFLLFFPYRTVAW